MDTKKCFFFNGWSNSSGRCPFWKQPSFCRSGRSHHGNPKWATNSNPQIADVFVVGNHLIWGYPPEIKQSWLNHRPWMGNGKIFSTWVLFRCHDLLPKAHWVPGAAALFAAGVDHNTTWEAREDWDVYASEAIRSEAAIRWWGTSPVELAQSSDCRCSSMKCGRVPKNRRADHGWSSFAHSFVAGHVGLATNFGQTNMNVTPRTSILSCYKQISNTKPPRVPGGLSCRQGTPLVSGS